MDYVQWTNETSITTFIFLGFQSLHQFQLLLFLLFLVVYIATVAGNLLIVTLVAADRHLHTPMYFFLANLSVLETLYSSVITPRLLSDCLSKSRTISLGGCITQLLLYSSLACIECFLLAIMALDRYLAICKPLSYQVIMNFKVCLQLVTASWLIGLSVSSLVVGMVSKLHFCGPNEIDHFICDMNQLTKLSCKKSILAERTVLVSCSIVTLGPFVLIVVSYVYILAAILRIASSSGRQKAFSTCASHLVVVSLYYGTIVIMYVVPTKNQSPAFQKAISLLYTVITPLFNPIIYSLRNQEVQGAFKKLLLHNLGMK
ncbi:olfactory receptor 10A7-like [Eublepharis macularius]|uniref:Olfactory receptor n=1 Tax=Eublepharis macularius TaxID=481883 RepID=A0AA97K5G4_EUBMA|nr:olfactory receptor 10A7-like [Eublepharis macularius]